MERSALSFLSFGHVQRKFPLTELEYEIRVTVVYEKNKEACYSHRK